MYVPIACPRLSAHYFLHEKSHTVFASTELRSEVHAYLAGTLRGLLRSDMSGINPREIAPRSGRFASGRFTQG